ncbi:uncharacterized protein LY89DRAFT_783626 [Mollisia scopiformis]|uniref:Uncharacterized protein n=1 Tax=Mollisia scopiformis TaxID=149040 RepID=A0A194X5P0_MOLSC|nr:uncharacterized protein LY89DRAFT_783626 [Mollisia scopiformis]KUJ15491.1 hypothetical protein LY89DRAFT_783626 [Mollisia scopiformis]
MSDYLIISTVNKDRYSYSHFGITLTNLVKDHPKPPPPNANNPAAPAPAAVPVPAPAANPAPPPLVVVPAVLAAPFNPAGLAPNTATSGLILIAVAAGPLSTRQARDLASRPIRRQLAWEANVSGALTHPSYVRGALGFCVGTVAPRREAFKQQNQFWQDDDDDDDEYSFPFDESKDLQGGHDNLALIPLLCTVIILVINFLTPGLDFETLEVKRGITALLFDYRYSPLNPILGRRRPVGFGWITQNPHLDGWNSDTMAIMSSSLVKWRSQLLHENPSQSLTEADKMTHSFDTEDTLSVRDYH